MSDEVNQYLDLAYRRKVLGHRVDPDSALLDDAQFLAAVRAELARINAVGLGASLASRDFAMYQHRRALLAALAKLEGGSIAP